MVTSDHCAVDSWFATTYHNYLLTLCLNSVAETLCMHNLPFEFFLVRKLWDIWQRVHASAYNNVIKLLSRLLWSLFVADVPSFSILDDFLNSGVEFAVRINVFLFSKALNVRLDLRSTGEVISTLLLSLISKPWELVEMPWDLKAKVGIIASPDSAYIWFLLENCWLDV